MTNWNDPETLLSEAVIYNKITIAFLGLFAWEVVVTSWFDWSVISRARAFKWPMILYWVSKYSMFLADVGVIVANNYTLELNCQALFTFNALMGNIAIGAASSLLMLRTIAVWSRNKWVMWPIVVCALAQYGILLHGCVTVSASWSDVQGTCAVKSVPAINLKVLYLYTMCFDLGVLILTTIGLYRLPGRPGTSGNRLWALLFKDGLIFFLTAFGSNLVAVVFVLADLNPLMNIITSVPAANITSIVACRLFVRLSTYNDIAPGSQTTVGRPVTTANKGINPGLSVRKADPYTANGRDITSNGVLVQMDTFVSHNHGMTNVTFDEGRDRDIESTKDLAYNGDNASSEDFPDEKPGLRSFMPK
ncbi:hypothetical protein FRB95_010165 [Tulasnella sp. JGI-2019a]|nr:hypothetical protein FRB95_010165 [Tulasnella sp. JGI-2019a]